MQIEEFNREQFNFIQLINLLFIKFIENNYQ